MVFGSVIENGVRPIKTRSYNALVGKKPVIEALYVVDEPDRFAYWHTRRIGEQEPGYIRYAVVKKIRRGSERYNQLMAMAQESIGSDQVADADFLLFSDLTRDEASVNVFDQEKFDYFRSTIQDQAETLRDEFSHKPINFLFSNPSLYFGHYL